MPVDGAMTENNRAYQSGEILGHPKGLFVCFFTELWERFSYYGMRALLIFYLTQHFLFSDEKAYLIYGAYTALIYITPVIGGVLADRCLGPGKAVTFGAILLVIGHCGMAIEGPVSVREGAEVARNPFFLQIFYLSLAFIVTGVGFLKANISTIVGSLYEQQDPRRDSGFTIFYMGINLGSFFAALLCGWLGQTYGWGYGFGLAGIGMLLGLLVFIKGKPLLEGRADSPCSARLKEKIFAGMSRETLIYLSGIIGVFIVWLLIQNQELVGQILMGTEALVLLFLLVYAFTQCEPDDRDRMLVCTTLIVFSVLFWSLFEQAGSSLNIFADRSINRNVLGIEIPASMFQSLNAFFIFTLAPLFSILWTWLARRGWEPSTPIKFGLGILQVGFGFLVLVFGSEFSEGRGRIGMVWLVLIYFLHTTGELCLSPVGLSMVTKLSLKRIVGMMMGVWFLAFAAANYISGQIAMMTGGSGNASLAVDQQSLTAHVLAVYENVGWLAVGVAALLFLITPVLKKRMHGVH
ncbi:MAG: peptide MFS transporter [Pseudomonadales bacterium]